MPNRSSTAPRWLVLLAAGAVAFLLGACASPAPTTTDVRVHAVTPAPRQKPLDPSQSVDVLAVCVAPIAEENIGVVAGRKLVASDLAQSIADALVDLSDRDVSFVTHVALTDEEFAATEAPIKMTVVKAYLRSVYDSKSAVVVLRVEHAGKVENFRGQDTGLNWMNTPEEMAAALRKALNKALQQARPHLTAIAAEQ